MFGLGPTEMALIAVVVALVFGVGRLPEIGGALGKTIREFKHSVNDEPMATTAPTAGAMVPAPLPVTPETREGGVRREEI